MLLKIAESNPFLLRQLDMSEEQLKSMLAKAEKEKELTNLSQAEISARNKELWADWLNSYRYEFLLTLRWKFKKPNLKVFLKHPNYLVGFKFPIIWREVNMR